jgi:hypothetical protein
MGNFILALISESQNLHEIAFALEGQRLRERRSRGLSTQAQSAGAQ